MIRGYVSCSDKTTTERSQISITTTNHNSILSTHSDMLNQDITNTEYGEICNRLYKSRRNIIFDDGISATKHDTISNTHIDPLNSSVIDHQKSSLPCKFYLLGNCSSGKSCRFTHIKPYERPKLICSYYLKGECKYGNHCILLHSKDTSLSYTATCPESNINLILSENQESNITDSSDDNNILTLGSILPSALHDLLEPQEANMTIISSIKERKDNVSYSAIVKTGTCPTLNQLSIEIQEFPFPRTGACGNTSCDNMHGELCPYCHLFLLHPTNLEIRLKHLQSCVSTLDESLYYQYDNGIIEDQSTIECCICYEIVTSKTDSRFGLLNCDHSFCLECIRSWRLAQNMDPSVVRSCPICRVVTHFITPSVIWTTNQTVKQKIIDEYKNKLRSIPCKYFKHGDAHCPFGSSCFYSHLGRDGKPMDMKPRTYMDQEEQVHVVQGVRLSDFIVPSILG